MYGHRSKGGAAIRRPHRRRRISPFLGLVILAGVLFVWGSGCNSQQSLRHQFGAMVRPVSGDVGRLLKNAHYFQLMGRPEMAAIELEMAHLRDPGNLKVLDALARCYDELGEFARAQELYRAGLQIDPDNQPLSNNLCYSYYLAGKHREAEQCFRETVARQPGNETARNNLGLLLARQGRQEEALTLWGEKEGGVKAQEKLNQVLAALAQEQGRPGRVSGQQPPVAAKPPAASPPVASAPAGPAQTPVKSGSPLLEQAALGAPSRAGAAPPPAPAPNAWELGKASASIIARPAASPAAPAAPVARETVKGAAPLPAKVPAAPAAQPRVAASAAGEPGKASVALVAKAPAPPPAVPRAAPPAIPAPPSAALVEKMERVVFSPAPSAPQASAPAPAKPRPTATAQTGPARPPEAGVRPVAKARPTFAGGGAAITLAKVSRGPSRPAAVKAAQAPASPPPVAAAKALPTVAPPPASGMAARIEILNGNGVRRLARKTATWLEGQGYQVVQVGNWWKFNLRRTVILYRPAAEDAARKLADNFGLPAAVEMTGDLAEGVDLQVILGRSHRKPETLWAGARRPAAPPAVAAPAEAGAPFDKARVAVAAAALPPKPERPAFIPNIRLTAEELLSTRIELRNGNGIPEVARKSRTLLSKEGFNVVAIANHIDFGHQQTLIAHRPGADKVAQALLQRFFPHAELRARDNLPDDTDIRIILGQDLKPRWHLLAALAD
ncbi:MAG: tetratricopeptide repeat protein [Deltaproteobacteria bacterium]|nr:tetratricopeptide repeat protein [Deltaproteobacteria bacterium]